MTRRNLKHPSASSRHGFTLVELMVVVTTIGILIAMAAPSFRRSVEQSHADIAVANLRAIWTAERLYWLENREFTSTLDDLEDDDLIDTAIDAATSPYTYQITAADDDTFTATAARAGSTVWSGTFTIDQEGYVEGDISASGERSIGASFQD